MTANDAAASDPVSAASWATPLREDSRSRGKLAPQLANRIEMEIFRLGWPVGHALGKEEELAARFGVSHSVLREALAITERDGVTRRQRGRSGGVIVAAPAREVVSSALGNYFSIAGLSGEQLIEGFAFVNGAMHRLAMKRCGEEEAQAARALLRTPPPDDVDSGWRHVVQLHDCLLAMARNNVLHILGTAIIYTGVERLYARLDRRSRDGMLGFTRAVIAEQRRQIESVIGGDIGGATAAEQGLIALWRRHYLPFAASPKPARRELGTEEALEIATRVGAIFYPNREVKRADTLAMQLYRAIQVGGLRSGDRLDNEATLQQRYQVGRGVLREAIRYLERSAVVRMEEGRNGGLRVAEPDPGDAVRSAVLHFRFLQLGADDILALGTDLELAAIGAAVANMQRNGADVLRDLAAAVRMPLDSTPHLQAHMERIYLGLMTASGNPFFIAVMRIFFTFLTVEPEHTRDRRAHADLLHSPIYADYLRWMQATVDALQHGDANLARRRLLLARQAIQRGIEPHARDMGQMLALM